MKKFFVVTIIILFILISLICYKIFFDEDYNKTSEKDLIQNNQVIEVNQKGIYKNEENNAQNVDETFKYLIKSGNKFIEVYRIEGDKKTLIEQTEISLDYLSDEDKNILEKGITVNSEEEVKQVLEDYE